MCLINASLFLNMPEYVRICVNMPKSAWMVSVLYVLIVTPRLLKLVVTYFNGFQPLTIFAKNYIFKSPILNVWQGFEFASAYIEDFKYVLLNIKHTTFSDGLINIHKCTASFFT